MAPATHRPSPWMPLHEALRDLAPGDRRRLQEAVRAGRIRIRRRGRERYLAADDLAAVRSGPAGAGGRQSGPPRSRPAPRPPDTEGLSFEEAEILADPVDDFLEPEIDAPAASDATTGEALRALDEDIVELRDRVESMAASLERLSSGSASHHDAPFSEAAARESSEHRRETLGDPEAHASDPGRDEAFDPDELETSGRPDDPVVVEATVIPPELVTGPPPGRSRRPGHRVDPFASAWTSDHHERSRRARARRLGVIRVLLALAVIGFSFLTGSLILAFV